MAIVAGVVSHRLACEATRELPLLIMQMCQQLLHRVHRPRRG
jgi:hypothetical protein